MEPWEGVIQIPEGRVGDHEVRHVKRPAGEVERCSARSRILGGQEAAPLLFDRETTWHELAYSGGTWMSDLPIEQQQIDELLEPVDGRVLIGGLGIGYAVTVLAQRRSITELVVVEKSQEVIDLVWKHTKHGGKARMVCADLHEHLKRDFTSYDWAFFDTWQSDGERTLWDEVVPLRKAAVNVVPDQSRILCWNENVMRGQLMGLIESVALQAQAGMCPPLKKVADDCRLHPWHGWAAPFFDWAQGRSFERIIDAGREYCASVGDPGWRQWWEIYVEANP